MQLTEAALPGFVRGEVIQVGEARFEELLGTDALAASPSEIYSPSIVDDEEEEVVEMTEAEKRKDPLFNAKLLRHVMLYDEGGYLAGEEQQGEVDPLAGRRFDYAATWRGAQLYTR